MRPGLPHLAAFLACLGAASTRPQDLPRPSTSTANSDWSDTSSDPPPGEERPPAPAEPTTEELVQRLESKRRDIVRAMGDKRLGFDYFSVCRHVRALHARFFGLLRRSGLYPPLGRRARSRMLAMSPEDFRRDLDRRYLSDKNIVRFQGYRRKVDGYAARERGLVSQIQREMEQTPQPEHSLDALEDLLNESIRKWHKYINRCGALQKPCRLAQKHYLMVLQLPLHRVLGADAIHALHDSYLADRRGLRERVSAEPHLPEEEAECAPCPDTCEVCTICSDALRPGEHTIGCVQHRFHGACLYAWSKKRLVCPVCARGFTAEQERALLEGKRIHSARRTRAMSGLRDDPSLEERYMRDGMPIVGDRRQELTLEIVYGRIRLGFLRLKGHLHYPEVFSNYEDYPELYIPQNIADYFAGRHDPRSRGFYRHRAAVVSSMQSYLDISRTRGSLMHEDIARLLRSLLDLFCAGDCLVEALYTRLRDIGSVAEKASEIESNPHAYPAVYSLTRERMHLCPRCRNQIYTKFYNVINNGGTMCPCDRDLWLENF